MATADETNTTKFARFSTILEYQRQAIILRSSGKGWAELTATINSQFDFTYAEETVRHWFIPGGPLEAAFDEYNDTLADQSLKNARKLARRGAEAAITKMITLMGEPYEPGLQLRAAIALANKYVPDRQIYTNDPGGGTDDIPPELMQRGVAIAARHDDAPASSGDIRGDGPDLGEGVPAELLQQPDPADRPSDSPA